MQRREAVGYYYGAGGQSFRKTADAFGYPLATVRLWVLDAAQGKEPSQKHLRTMQNVVPLQPSPKAPEIVDDDIAGKARAVVTVRLDYLATTKSLEERDKVDSAVLVVEKLVSLFPQLAALAGERSSSNKNSLKERLMGTVSHNEGS